MPAFNPSGFGGGFDGGVDTPAGTGGAFDSGGFGGGFFGGVDTPSGVSPVTFDAANKRIVLNPGVTSVTAKALYSRWKEWAQTHAQYAPAFRVVGGDPIGGGLFVASYFFLTNGWRVRPYEGNHTLVIEGNLVVDGGGVPVVQTLGSFNVSTQFTVPVQAQGISTSGSTGPSAAAIAAELLAQLQAATIPVNVKQINSVALTGTGTAGSEWGPA